MVLQRTADGRCDEKTGFEGFAGQDSECLGEPMNRERGSFLTDDINPAFSLASAKAAGRTGGLGHRCEPDTEPRRNREPELTDRLI